MVSCHIGGRFMVEGKASLKVSINWRRPHQQNYLIDLP